MSGKVRIYTYKKCSTCRKALRWLDDAGIDYDVRAIRETPPSTAELKTMLERYDGAIKRLLNTSSKDYREARLKDRLGTMSDSQVFELLQENGNLVKRPFLVSDDFGLVGFREDEWQAHFG